MGNHFVFPVGTGLISRGLLAFLGLACGYDRLVGCGFFWVVGMEIARIGVETSLIKIKTTLNILIGLVLLLC